MLQRHSPWRKLRLVLSVTVQAVSGAPRRMAIARRRSPARGPGPPAGTIRESPASPFLHPCKLYTRELGGAVHGSWLPVQDNSLRSLYAKQPSSFTARPAIATSAAVPLPDAWPHSCYIANCARESQPQVGTTERDNFLDIANLPGDYLEMDGEGDIVRLFLNWNQYGNSVTDLDLYVYNRFNQVVTQSVGWQ